MRVSRDRVVLLRPRNEFLRKEIGEGLVAGQISIPQAHVVHEDHHRGANLLSCNEVVEDCWSRNESPSARTISLTIENKDQVRWAGSVPTCWCVDGEGPIFLEDLAGEPLLSDLALRHALP